MINTIFKTMSDIIKTVTGVQEVIKANPNAPSPQGEYASLYIMTDVNHRYMGTVKRVWNKNTQQLDESVTYPLNIHVTINFYRGEAAENASKLVRAPYLSDVSMMLARNKIGWIGNDPIQDLTGLQSQSFEKRAVIRVNLIKDAVLNGSVNDIQEVTITVKDEDSNKLSEITLKEK